MKRLVFLAALAAAALPLSAAITGSVIGSDGSPIANARVDVYRGLPQFYSMVVIAKAIEAQPLTSARTDAKGAFSVDLPGQGVADVHIVADGFAPADAFAAYDDSVGTITLRPAPLVEGRVVANGAAVAAATVIAFAQQGFPVVVKTNEQGVFRLPDPKAWAMFVVVTHPDFSPAAHPAANLTFALDAGRDVKGKVVDAKGAAVAAADVNIDNFLFAKSAEDGTFTIRHVPAQARTISARTANGLASMPLPSGMPTLKLKPLSRVTGVIRDASKRPLAGLAVILGANEGESAGDIAYTDAKGAFTLSATRGQYTVGPEGFGVYDIESAELDGRSGDVRHDFVAQRERSIEGLVRKADGSPVAGASIGVKEAMPAMQMQMEPPVVMSATRTGVDGRFRISRAGHTKFKIVALKAGLPPAQSAPVAESDPDRGIVIVVPDGIEITGRVIDKEGNAVAGAGIDPILGFGGEQILNAQGAQARDPWVVTGADGRFTGRLEKGSISLNFAKKGYVATQRVTEVSQSMQPLEVMLAKGGSLRGKVVKKDGTPAAEIPVLLAQRYAVSEPDGSFVIEDIEPGDYSLRFGTSAHQEKSVHIPSDDLRLVLEGTRKITGRVTDSATGAPLTQFTVFVAGDQERASTQPVDAPTGEFSIDAPERAVRLSVTASGYASAKNIVVEASSTAPVAIAMNRGRSVHGRVVDPAAQPLADVEVTYSSSENEVSFNDRPAKTAADGSYEMRGLVFDDEVTLAFKKEGYVGDQRRLRPGRDDATIDVTLRPGIIVTGRVLDTAGGGVADVSVSASSAAHGAEYESASTEQNGTFRFAGLAPGRYDFSAEASGSPLKGVVKDVDVEKTHEITIRLEKHPTALLTGHVNGLDAASTMRIVNAKNEAGETKMGLIDAAGNFRLEAPAGLVEVTAQMGTGARGFRSTRAVTIDAPPNSERRVDLAFENQVTLRGAVTRGGAPAPGLRINFSGSGTSSASANSSAEGTYEVTIDPGDYDVTISDGQRELPFAQHITVATDSRINFQIETNSVNVTVVDAESGQPLEGATITLMHQSGTHAAGTSLTGGDGSTTIEISRSEPLTVTSSRRGYANAVADLPAGSSTPVLLRLVRSAGVVVRLVDRRDGRTLSGYVIARDEVGRVVASVYEQDPDGTVTLPLATGRYRFSGSAEGYGSQTVAGESPSGEVQIALPRGGSIALKSGSDMHGTARLIQPNGEEYVRCWCNGIASIEIDGRMTIVDRISPGPYTLEVNLPGAKPRAIPITVVEGQTLPVPID